LAFVENLRFLFSSHEFGGVGIPVGTGVGFDVALELGKGVVVTVGLGVGFGVSIIICVGVGTGVGIPVGTIVGSGVELPPIPHIAPSGQHKKSVNLLLFLVYTFDL